MSAATYDALTIRAQSLATAANGATREGRYREAFALREQADADLAEATRLRKTRCAWWQPADCVEPPFEWADALGMFVASDRYSAALAAFMAPCRSVP